MTGNPMTTEIRLAQSALERALKYLPTQETAIAEANQRTEAVRTVLGAMIASVGLFGLNRRKFQKLVHDAGAMLSDKGPEAVQHEVLLAEARRVLSIPE